jgi:hypothetical protein
MLEKFNFFIGKYANVDTKNYRNVHTLIKIYYKLSKPLELNEQLPFVRSKPRDRCPISHDVLGADGAQKILDKTGQIMLSSESSVCHAPVT